ncbi:BTAD domain-containing putative transcriptional regulator, partial [Streptomyces sp. T-3]|nr:BTAD domain-containing putative transcriptional regulator [Streptomyces sp. T-3]
GRAPADPDLPADPDDLSPEELVLRFRSLASPEAFRLAGHLAVGRPELPVMRLVQAALERRPQPQHLAEVILSGVLSAGSAAGVYEFRPGVRDVLLGTLPRSARGRTGELLARVGALIDERVGVAPGAIPVVGPAAGGGLGAPEGDPVALVRAESVRRMAGRDAVLAEPGRFIGGRYRLDQSLGAHRTVWRARTHHNREVVVQLHPQGEQERNAAFIEDARVLAGLRHPNLATVHDFGLEDGVPYLVLEYLPGPTLRSLSIGQRGLGTERILSIGRQLAEALMALHEAGLVHGNLTSRNVMMAPDNAPAGPVTVTGYTFRSRASASPEDDLRTLGYLLVEMATGRRHRGGKVGPEELTALPGELRSRFAEIVEGLGSGWLARQFRGLRDLQALAREQGRRPSTPGPSPTARRFRLLGPVRIEEGAELGPVRGTEAALLCMLLLAPERGHTYAEISQGLWGEQPPPDAHEQIERTGERLRDLFGPGMHVTRHALWLWLAQGDEVDVRRFEELAEQARELRDQGHSSACRNVVRQALGLWRGEPLDGARGPAAARTRESLRELRLELRLLLAGIDLDGGDHARASDLLGQLLLERPDDQPILHLYMLALRDQGRIPEAVAAYEEHRHRFTGERREGLHDLYRVLVETALPPARAFIAVLSPAVLDDTSWQHLRQGVRRTVVGAGVRSDWLEERQIDDGFAILPPSDAPLEAILTALVRNVSEVRNDLSPPPRMQVLLWHATPSPGPTPAEQSALAEVLTQLPEEAVVALSPEAYDQLIVSARALDPTRFRALGQSADPDSPIVIWYCTIDRHLADDLQQLVSGPYPMSGLRQPPAPRSDLHEIVYRLPDGSLTTRARFSLRRTWSTWDYYEVDLTPQRAYRTFEVPQPAGLEAHAELSWEVEDAVSFVGSGVRHASDLLNRMEVVVSALAARFPSGHSAEAARDINDRLFDWRGVPGVLARCSVRLARSAPPARGRSSTEPGAAPRTPA